MLFLPFCLSPVQPPQMLGFCKLHSNFFAQATLHSKKISHICGFITNLMPMRLLRLLFVFCSLHSFAQKDTLYKYFDKSWKPIEKEQAYFTSKLTHESKGWHRLDFWTATNNMQMDGWFDDEASETEHGAVMFYNEDGSRRDSLNYNHGKLLSKYIFYQDQHLKGFAEFNSTQQMITQAGYDENGKEIPGYIFQQEATFPGGAEAWKQFLVKGLTTKQPKSYKQGKISGTVVVTFLVDKEGNVQEVQVGKSSGYAELDEHAANVIRNSPKWNPAIQYNQKVIYRQKQSLTYAPQD